MKLNKRLCVMGLFFVILLPMVVEGANSYPKELAFLAETSTPRYFYANGTIETTDSTGQSLFQFPMRFYWEKGNYALDVRGPGGTPIIFMLGIADTMQLYDFFHGLKLTIMKDQDFSWLSGLPFTAETILPLFNIYPEGFTKIDTVYREGDFLVATSRVTVYYFDTKTNRLMRVNNSGSEILFKEFGNNKKGAWPILIELNKGLFVQGAVSSRIRISEMSFKRQRENSLFDVDLPANMERAFDLRHIEDGNR